MISLPRFRSLRRRNNKTSSDEITPSDDEANKNVSKDYTVLSEWQIRKATRIRRFFVFLSSFFLFVAVIFLIMTEIGSTHNKAVLRDIYFLKLDLTNIVPVTVPQAALLNSIAQTLGLHDFYQVGLWGYCEGYNAQGVTSCSNPETLYWFNPVQIIVSQLLAGATIQLPDDIRSILGLIKLASEWMFGLFLAGACLSTVLIPVVLLSTMSRWASFMIAMLTLLNGLLVVAPTVIATVMFIIMRNVFRENGEVNIEASLGVNMFAMMWTASAMAIFTFVIHLSLSCCCASRRDVKTGRKRGSKKAYEGLDAEKHAIDDTNPAPMRAVDQIEATSEETSVPAIVEQGSCGSPPAYKAEHEDQQPTGFDAVSHRKKI